jgi:hypothetical protein
LTTLAGDLLPGVRATNEPKRIKCGAPDVIVQHGQTPLGYIEAKDIGESLDKAEKSEQLKRYFESLNNVILTDYLEFRWYVNGEKRETVRLATPSGKKLKPDAAAADLVSLFQRFQAVQTPTLRNPKELAQRMAKLAQLIREVTANALKEEDNKGDLHEMLESFRRVLLADLTSAGFADMYAQTLCYGLFAARCTTVTGGAH